MTTTRARSSRRFVLLPAALACLAAAACQMDCPDKLVRCRKDLNTAHNDVTRLKKTLARTTQTVDQQKRQIETLQRLPTDRLAHVVRTDRIAFARLTGGYDKNNDGYDDGIVVYLQPIDTDGHVIKAAGEIEVTLVDLAGPSPRLLGRTTIPGKTAHTLWQGTLWTNHFTIHCPFAEQPTGPNVTVRARFVEWLTGSEFTTQKVCKTVLAPPVSTRPTD